MVKNLQNSKSSELSYIIHSLHRSEIPIHPEAWLTARLLLQVGHLDDAFVLATQMGLVEVYRQAFEA